ncbi:MAG: ABC transporter ATP-binding protein [Arachnia sp.]
MRTIEASEVTKVFPHPRTGTEVHALSGVSLRAESGEMLAIVGPSGSGKSTLLYCLAGLEPVSSGSVSLLSSNLAELSPTKVAKLYRDRVGFVFQSYNLIASLSAGENVGLPSRLAGNHPRQNAVDRVMEQVGLDGLYARMPHELSGGQQQRVAIARAVFTQPAVVFADEPTGALDTRSGEFVIATLRALAEQGSTVVLVTHNLEAAAQASRVIVLRDGTVAAELRDVSAAQILAVMEHPMRHDDSSGS